MKPTLRTETSPSDGSTGAAPETCPLCGNPSPKCHVCKACHDKQRVDYVEPEGDPEQPAWFNEITESAGQSDTPETTKLILSERPCPKHVLLSPEGRITFYDGSKFINLVDPEPLKLRIAELERQRDQSLALLSDYFTKTEPRVQSEIDEGHLDSKLEETMAKIRALLGR